MKRTLLALALATAMTFLGPPVAQTINEATSFSVGDQAFAATKKKRKAKRQRYASAHGLVVASARRHGVPVGLALKIAKQESGIKCGRVGDQGRSHGPMQIQIRTARALFGVRNVSRLGCAAQTDFGMRHLAMAYRISGRSWCGAAVRHNGGLGARGGHWMTRQYANSAIGGCFKSAGKKKHRKGRKNRRRA